MGNSLIAVTAALSGTRVAVFIAASATLLVGLSAAAVVVAGRVRDTADTESTSAAAR